MYYSNILLNLNIGKINYCIFSSINSSGLNALAITKNGNSFFVTDSNEITFLNTIINLLNKKYIRRRDIEYKNKKIARFEHRYNGRSFFAEIDSDNNLKECSYEEYKDLYDLYNGIKISYFEDRRRENRNSRSYRNSRNRPSSRRNSYSQRSARERRNSRSNSNVVKKISLIVGGVLVIASITVAGIKLLNSSELQQIDSQESVVSQEQSEKVLSQIQKEYGEDIDITANEDDEIAIQDKYKKIEENFREKGLSNWEISAELDFITIMNGDDEKIDFYYDDEKDEIVYVFDELGKLKEKDLSEEDTAKEIDEESISQNIQIIIDTINNNEKLSEQEKKFIIEKNLPIWLKNEKYLNYDFLQTRYSNLEITYDEEDKRDNYRKRTYVTNASGYYRNGVDYSSGEKNYISNVVILDADSLEQAQNGDTIGHELNHINGDFNKCELLNEGYNQLLIKGRSDIYSDEQYMATIFTEVFGKDVMNEGYFGFDLNNAITNKIVEKTGRDNAVVNDEIYNLLQDTQDLLFDTGIYRYSKEIEDDEKIVDGKKLIKNNKELVERYEKLYERLSKYHELINGKPIKDNQITNFMMDCLTGSNRAKVYQTGKENYKFAEYDIDTGILECNIGNFYKNLEENLEIISDSKLYRKLTINQDDKYEEHKEIIKDSDIQYSTR